MLARESNEDETQLAYVHQENRSLHTNFPAYKDFFFYLSKVAFSSKTCYLFQSTFREVINVQRKRRKQI